MSGERGNGERMSGERMSGELNTDNTDATGFSQMAVVLLSLPHRASEVFRRWTECPSVPREGRLA